MRAFKDFSFNFQRTIVAGAAEAVPASDAVTVWDLPEVPTHGLLLMTTVAATFEVAFWNTVTSTWVIQSTNVLLANTPVEIAFPFQGARIYLRKTTVTGAATTVFCGVLDALSSTGGSGGGGVLPAGASLESRQQVSSSFGSGFKACPVAPAAAEPIVAVPTPCRCVKLQAAFANTGVVTVCEAGKSAGAGVEFKKGDSDEYFVDDAAKIFVQSTLAGDKVFMVIL